MSYNGKAALINDELEDIVSSPKRERQTKRKTTVNHKSERLDVREIQALNEPQRQMIFAFKEGLNIAAIGSAGTGKSYLASYLALKALFGKEVSKIVVVRSAVPTRDMGFLPGTLQEKSEVYTIPYRQIFNDLCDNGTAWDILVKKGYVEFITTSFVRGITIDNAVVILDESQSMTFHELDSVVTRAGFNTRMIVCGDTKQNDLQNPKKERSGLDDFLKVIKEIPKYFDVVTFTRNDIVRSELVRQWIITKEELGL